MALSAFLDGEFKRIMRQFFGRHESGSLFGGGDVGVASRDIEMLGRGRAPFTGKGLLAAAGNAFNLMGGMGAVTTGISSVAEQGLGRPPGEFGGIQNIPGFSRYDPDLVESVRNRSITRAAADREQARRNAERQSARFSAADAATARGQRGIGASRGGGNAGGGRRSETGPKGPGGALGHI